ncbi:Winged helix DNA-binding protein [Glarea lozoyensis ATCC 20868]|uniref:Winged helix DNA-binding protein n=1 Tax=Glarea lozoyensis (strain ATCC 20868 / MF5171) TaxID=1116229 RepID=S3CH14_GLAL2|nr:Winged helix DNA-binding protein [Glarea lozoyensis ATCC 20868]EPE24584.1 Winged helix DNA-binding protein [Glarea lozoyensis ATCC 20868]
MGFQYGENPVMSRQSGQQMISLDGYSRDQSDQHFVATNSDFQLPTPNYSLTGPITGLPQSPSFWSNQAVTSFNYGDQTSNGYYASSSTVTRNTSSSNCLHRNHVSDIPRTWDPYDPRIINNSSMVMDQVDSFYPTEEDHSDVSMSPAMSTPELGDRSDHQRYSHTSLSQSPKMEEESLPAGELDGFNQPTQFCLPGKDDSDDGGTMSREMTAVEIDEHAADEPYAKLIHRALMSVPNHSMILQEIYQWFRENTTKGTPDNKGWMNSIRHNLSMNAAFRKTERKIFGDETKKSTEWVLADFAVRDGVQSTTRYRKGTGAKKGARSNSHIRSRQDSGRRGGLSASKNKFTRQRFREQRTDTRRALQSYDFLQSQYQSSATSNMGARHNSPSTPPSHEQMGLASPYFNTHMKLEPYERPMDLISLEDVQGAYLNGEPVFTDQQDGSGYFDGLPRY